MKINKTISIDIEAWNEAKNHTDNISRYLNECLIGLSNRRNKSELTRKELEIEIELQRQIIKEASIKESLALQQLKDLDRIKVLEAKESLENEQFQRWDCGVCHHLNFMDQTRCSKCNLPTKLDPKTTIVSIKGVDAE